MALNRLPVRLHSTLKFRDVQWNSVSGDIGCDEPAVRERPFPLVIDSHSANATGSATVSAMPLMLRLSRVDAMDSEAFRPYVGDPTRRFALLFFVVLAFPKMDAEV